MVIVVASDQHLGYENSDKASFNAFLDQLQADASVTHLVLLGDVVDMWRRDASGVFLENRDTFDRIAAIQKRIPVHYVYGNHDFHLRELKGHGYPFEFTDTLTLAESGRNYRFLHGFQFDEKQSPLLMEALCRTMSDAAGIFESGIWATLPRIGPNLISQLVDWTDKDRADAEALKQGPDVRLGDSLDAFERKACASAKPGEILVFGHTHAPFINKAGTVVNTGSWLKGEAITNTYVRLEAGGPRLFVFGGKEITDRKQCP
ncbi:MAG TPA: metallophosphoesterase family protein [Methanomicrobiales archaeon]|nr:metallophosphoesterase family protein [Methanomicrobiales archaeon]